MADNWNKAAETQEQTEIQQLVSDRRKMCKFASEFYWMNGELSLQGESINDVSLKGDVKPVAPEVEEVK